MKKIKHIIIGWYYKWLGKEQDLANYRLSICKQCPYIEKVLGKDICSLCGCVLDAKARVRDEECYNNKW